MTVIKYGTSLLIEGRPFSWGDKTVWFMKVEWGIIRLSDGSDAGYSESDLLNKPGFLYAKSMEIK